MAFSVQESLAFGWRKTREHSGLLFQILLTLFAIQVMYAIVSRVLEGSLIGALALLALGVASFIVGVGFTVITLRLAQGKHAEFKEIIPPVQLLWQYFAASILTGLVIMGVFLGIMLIALAIGAALGAGVHGLFSFFVGLGVIVSVVAVIYAATRLAMVRFAVINGAGITGSLTQSSKITKNNFWHLLGFFVVVALLNLLGVVLLFIGLLVTIPVTMIAYAHVYQKLHAHAHRN
jgi:hypothetical protein